MNYRFYNFKKKILDMLIDMLNFLFTPLRKYYETDFAKKRANKKYRKHKIKDGLKDIYYYLNKQDDYSIHMGCAHEQDFCFDADKWMFPDNIIQDVLETLIKQKFSIDEITLDKYIDDYMDYQHKNWIKNDYNFMLNDVVYIIRR